MELTINGVVYEFKASFKFLREADERAKGDKSDGKNVGLKMLLGGLVDGSAQDLLDTLDLLNAGQDPRVTRADLEAYLEDENTDADALFDEVLDFLSRSNLTKRETTAFMTLVNQMKNGL